MTQAEDALERMKALDITIAQAHNNITHSNRNRGRDCIIEEVDEIYKFYHFPDGSRVGARIREEVHTPRWPRKLQQVWIVKPL